MLKVYQENIHTVDGQRVVILASYEDDGEGMQKVKLSIATGKQNIEFNFEGSWIRAETAFYNLINARTVKVTE